MYSGASLEAGVRMTTSPEQTQVASHPTYSWNSLSSLEDKTEPSAEYTVPSVINSSPVFHLDGIYT